MNPEQLQAIVEIKAAVKELDRDRWLGIALLAVALKKFRDADSKTFDALTAICVGS